MDAIPLGCMDNIIPGRKYEIEYTGNATPIAHIFDENDVHAIQAAYAAQRPLLVRGEPGVGKSQLALAAAVATQRAFVPKVVNIRTEPQDLLWIDDPIARLADAQLIGTASGDISLRHTARQFDEKVNSLREKISDRRRYFTPGIFWWAFDWSLAKEQASHNAIAAPAQPKNCNSENGVVVLIDEIDKAETDLPNGLLEVLGARCFTPDFFDTPITAKNWPMVVITTNEERELPQAFMRRCVVLNVALPENEDDFKKVLTERGKAHLDGRMHDASITEAAQLLYNARKDARDKRRRFRPGQAEFIDLLNAVAGLEKDNHESQLARMNQIAQFFLKKSKSDTL